MTAEKATQLCRTGVQFQSGAKSQPPAQRRGREQYLLLVVSTNAVLNGRTLSFILQSRALVKPQVVSVRSAAHAGQARGDVCNTDLRQLLRYVVRTN